MQESFYSWVKSLPLLKRGAESEIRLGRFAGIEAVFKARIRKTYMDEALATELIEKRTKKEAKVIAYVRKREVPAPALLAVFPTLGLLVLEYIEGIKLKDLLDIDLEESKHYMFEAGVVLGRIHSIGVAHGDPTTSNLIVSSKDKSLKIIDFGLSEFTEDIEDLAVDVHLFRRALESTHALYAKELIAEFERGYRSAVGASADKVLTRADEIRRRGRYVEERKRSVWKVPK
ncbi:MAG: Kae1-associated kinase Bud32 [Acidilobaceae archaeon]